VNQCLVLLVAHWASALWLPEPHRYLKALSKHILTMLNALLLRSLPMRLRLSRHFHQSVVAAAASLAQLQLAAVLAVLVEDSLAAFLVAAAEEVSLRATCLPRPPHQAVRVALRETFPQAPAVVAPAQAAEARARRVVVKAHLASSSILISTIRPVRARSVRLVAR